jgi:phosphatidylglycerophosphate synthase
VFITAEPGSAAPAMVVGGLTVLERRLLEAEHRGAARALVACDGPLPQRPLKIRVERVPADAPPPEDAEVVRADEIAGVRLDSDRARRRAEWLQLKALPKSFQGPVDALINCHISLRITRRLARTRVTPNQITIVALLVGLVAAGLLAYGTRASVVVGGVLMALQSIIDSCDGELARLRFQFSKLGPWLDNVADDVTDTALMVALGIAAGGRTWLWVGIAAGAARVVTQLVLYWQVTRGGGRFWDFRWWFETEVPSMDDVYDLASPLAWVRSLGRRDVYLFAWAVLCVTGVPFVAAGYAATMSGVFLVMTLIHLAVTAWRGR